MVGGGGGGGVHWPSLYTLAGTGPATNTNTRISQTTTQPGGQRTLELRNNHSLLLLLTLRSNVVSWSVTVEREEKQPDMMEAGGGGGEGGTGQRWWPPAVLLSLTAEILAESPVVTVRVNRAQCCFPTSLPGNTKTLGVSFTRNSKVANL